MNTTNDNAEWLAIRQTGIGGSDVAAVVEVSPWADKVDVWLDKTGQTPPKEENNAMYWGKLLEALVADEYARRTGQAVRRVNQTLRHKKHPELIANVDRAVCVDPGKMPVVRGEFRTPKLLEVKTARTKSDDWGDFGTDEIPPYYLTQVLHYLGITGCTTADVAVLFLDSREFGIYTVNADAEIIENLNMACVEFWQKHVQPVKNFLHDPQFDVSLFAPIPSSADEVEKIFKRSISKPITATDSIEDVLREYTMLGQQIKVLEAQRDTDKNLIAAYMCEHDTLVGLDGKPIATWKSNKDKTTIDYKGIVESIGVDPEIIAQFTKTGPGARPLLSKIKIEKEII